MKKKICRALLSGIISLILLISFTTSAYAMQAYVDDLPEPTLGEFGKGAHWCSKAVYWLYFAYVVDSDGYDEETGLEFYRPDKGITREQFLVFMGRLADECGGEDISVPSMTAPPSDFTDWALENHILYGKERGLAKDDLLTRQEMVTFMLRFADYMGIELGNANLIDGYAKFSDADTVSPWAEESMEMAYCYKLINGEVDRKGNYKLSPHRVVTRGEAAQILYNYVKAADLELPFYGMDLDVPEEF